MKNVSVVIVYNDDNKLQQALTWLEKQSIHNDIEIITLDNKDNKFQSAAQALNYGARLSRGEIIVFIHQDVYLWDLSSIERIYDYLLINDSIVGAAGVKGDSPTITDIFESRNKLRRGNLTNGKAIEVDTLDECLIAMRRTKYAELQFDEHTCNSWHCYAVDICLENKLKGGKNVVLPLEICHDSLGQTTQINYIHTIKNLIRKYRKKGIKRIHATTIHINCDLPHYYYFALLSYKALALSKRQ